jgi:HpaII restriction endonuclease.
MDKILCYKLSAPATNKSDITVKIININTGYRPTVGFSIKLESGIECRENYKLYL